MTMALEELGRRAPADSARFDHPRLMLLGDHSLSLPALRAIKSLYGPAAVLHFDAHLDTLHPASYPASTNGNAEFNHGSMFWMAHQEGLIRNSSSVHAGLHTRLSGTDWRTYRDDDDQGFFRIGAENIDDIGVQGVISQIRDRIGTEDPVYLSIDIDVLDPAFAPGTGPRRPADGRPVSCCVFCSL
jgi:agmatinase